MPRPRTTTKKVKKAPPLDERNERVDETLTTLYHEPDGNLPHMHTFERRRSRSGMMITFFVLLFLGAAALAAWLGFFIFNSSDKFSEEQIAITVDTPPSIVEGMDDTYRVTIANNSAQSLAETNVNISDPSGFVTTDATPHADTDKNDRWTLGTIDAGGQKTIEVHGAYGAPINTNGILRVVLTYRPSNFNADFQKVSDTPLTVATMPATLTIATTKKGTRDALQVNIKNTTDGSLATSTLHINFNGAFAASSTDPSDGVLQTDAATFTIPELSSGQENTVSVIGTARVASAIPTAELDRTVGDKTIPLAQTAISNAGDATATTTPAGAGTNDISLLSAGANTHALAPGSDMVLTVSFQNKTHATIEHATLVITADAPSVKNKSVFDFSKLQTTGDPDVVGKQTSADRRSATITWNETQLPLLKSIAPDAHVSVELHVPLKPATQIDGVPKDAQATFIATLAGGGAQTTSPTFTATLLSDMHVQATTAMLDASAPGYSAPNPDEAVYEIKITAHNTWHPVSQVHIHIPIFSTVHWQSDTPSIGSVSHDTNDVTWNVDSLASGTQDALLTLRVSAKNDATQTALSDNIKVEAMDDVAHQPIALTESSVTKK